MEITAYIEELLVRYPAVIIPNLGALEWCYTAATIDIIDQQIKPPKYQLVFNPKLQEDPRDRLLRHIKDIKGLDTETAQQLLINFRLFIENKLLQNGIVVFDGIGTLKMNKEGIFSFVESKKENFYNPATGLPTLPCIPILRNKVYLRTTPKIVRSNTDRRQFGLIGIVATLFISGIVFICVFPLFFQNNPSPHTTDTISILPAITAQQEQLLELLAVYEKHNIPSLAFVDNENVDTDTIELKETNAFDETQNESSKTQVVANLDEKTKTAIKKESEDPVSEKKVDEILAPNDYIVVIGVFEQPSNYERNVARLRSAGYRVQKKQLYTGYTRVAAIIHCANAAELNEQWGAIRQRFTPKAWLAKN